MNRDSHEPLRSRNRHFQPSSPTLGIRTRHQTLEIGTDHELRNNRLEIFGRQPSKALGRFRDFIRKCRQCSLDLTAIPRFDGSRDVNAARNILQRGIALAGWDIGSLGRPGASD